ncbi:MAG: Release factor glutamine methyltransferase [Pseudomonadota bacterium]|jgi:release factor glutamine methyltransferase
MTTVQAALAAASARFKHSDSAQLDAQVLLAHLLDKNRSWLLAWSDHALTREQQLAFESLCARRERGEPVAYLLGRRGFWNLELEVSPAVLIPRPETELLVELALRLGAALVGKVADLGTGSGAVALALASERPDWQVYATELSAAAHSVATANFRRAACANLHLLAGSWCAPLPGHDYLIIVSNPPYIDAADPHLDRGDVRFEPRSALVAPQQGLADLGNIAREARDYLVPGGWLLLEHGWEQGPSVRGLLAGLGYTEIRTHRDYADHERVTLGRRHQAGNHQP